VVAEPQVARHAHRRVSQVRAVYVINDVQNEQEGQQAQADDSASMFADLCRAGKLCFCMNPDIFVSLAAQVDLLR